MLLCPLGPLPRYNFISLFQFDSNLPNLLFSLLGLQMMFLDPSSISIFYLNSHILSREYRSPELSAYDQSLLFQLSFCGIIRITFPRSICSSAYSWGNLLPCGNRYFGGLQILQKKQKFLQQNVGKKRTLMSIKQHFSTPSVCRNHVLGLGCTSKILMEVTQGEAQASVFLEVIVMCIQG